MALKNAEKSDLSFVDNDRNYIYSVEDKDDVPILDDPDMIPEAEE